MLNVGIIGYGNFGRFLAQLLSKEPNLQLYAFDIDKKANTLIASDGFAEESTLNKMMDKCKVIIPAIHAEKIRALCSYIKPMIDESKIFFSIFSMQIKPLELMKQVLGSIHTYIPIHAMFGPNAYQANNNSLKKLKIVIINDYSSKTQEQVKYIDALIKRFEQLELTIFSMSANEHDRITARTLILHHIICTILFDTNLSQDYFEKISAPLAKVMQSVASNRNLLNNLYGYNPYAKQEVSLCVKTLSKFAISNHSIDEVDLSSYDADDIALCISTLLREIGIEKEDLDTINYQYLMSIKLAFPNSSTTQTQHVIFNKLFQAAHQMQMRLESLTHQQQLSSKRMTEKNSTSIFGSSMSSMTFLSSPNREVTAEFRSNIDYNYIS